MQCPRCQTENPPQAKFCLECASFLARACPIGGPSHAVLPGAGGGGVEGTGVNLTRAPWE